MEDDSRDLGSPSTLGTSRSLSGMDDGPNVLISLSDMEDGSGIRVSPSTWGTPRSLSGMDDGSSDLVSFSDRDDGFQGW